MRCKTIHMTGFLHYKNSYTCAKLVLCYNITKYVSHIAVPKHRERHLTTFYSESNIVCTMTNSVNCNYYQVKYNSLASSI